MHRIECKQATIIFSQQQQPEEVNNSSSNDAALLVRNFLAVRQRESNNTLPDHEKCKQKDNGDNHDDKILPVLCGSNHFDNLCQYMHGPLDTQEMNEVNRAVQALWNERKLLERYGYGEIDDKSSLVKQMENDLRRFRSNNFGITDAMMRVISSAVYPLGALLNHSCAPNCLLRFPIETQSTGEQQQRSPPLMEIVAAKDIDEGEELTHSYVELVAPKIVRQSTLASTYGFECECPRCIAGSSKFTIRLPSNYKSMQTSELTECILDLHNPILRKVEIINENEQRMVELDQEIILKPIQNFKAVETARRKQQQAKLYMSNGDLKNELACLEEAVRILESAAGQSSLDDVNPRIASMSLEVYQARGERLGTLIVAGQADEAISECETIVAFLCLALNHLQNHALIGLQLFTLGDLHSANGDHSKAHSIYQWAKATLEVSQGKKSEMVSILSQKLEER
jgi:hypothetical protein